MYKIPKGTEVIRLPRVSGPKVDTDWASYLEIMKIQFLCDTIDDTFSRLKVRTNIDWYVINTYKLLAPQIMARVVWFNDDNMNYYGFLVKEHDVIDIG